MKQHQYANDCQIFVSVSIADTFAAASRLSVCIDDVNRWMNASRLHLNLAKTQTMWLSFRQQLQKVGVNDISILAATVKVSNTARDVGFVIDSRLSLESHVSAIHRSGYYQLRQLCPIIKSMPPQKASKSAIPCIHFISLRLLQFVAVRHHRRTTAEMAGGPKCGSTSQEHGGVITSHHHGLHWLPVRQRLVFKITCLVFQSLSGQAPHI